MENEHEIVLRQLSNTSSSLNEEINTLVTSALSARSLEPVAHADGNYEIELYGIADASFWPQPTQPGDTFLYEGDIATISFGAELAVQADAMVRWPAEEEIDKPERSVDLGGNPVTTVGRLTVTLRWQGPGFDATLVGVDLSDVPPQLHFGHIAPD